MSKKKTKSKSQLDYFDAFKQQANLACKEADLLIQVIENFTTAEAIARTLPAAHAIEREADDVNISILNAVDRDFITPIEREDIVALANSLDDVVDAIEDVIQRFYMFDVHEMHQDALKLARLIKAGCQALTDSMDDFRDFKKSEQFRKGMEIANDIEEEADDLFVSVSRNLFTVHADKTMKVLVWMEIFSRMERCTDRCESTAETMSSILLKNS